MSKITDKLGGAMRSSLGVGTPAAAEAQAPASAGGSLYAGSRALSDARAIPVERIVADPGQPRREFEPEKLAELGLSMKRRGQLQPIRVREDKENDRFVIVAGERRWRAARMMEIATLDCLIVKRPMSDGEKLTLQLIENCVREDLKPIEQGQAFKALMDREGWTAEQVSKELNLSPQTVGRALALLSLPGPVQELVETGSLPPSTAAELRSIDSPAKQVELASRIVREGKNRDQALAEIRVHAPRRRAPVTQLAYDVDGGQVILKGRGPCQDSAARVRALREALAQAEAAAAEQGGESEAA
jgi:ParB family transcriptional regulator, chromosome partitioning protein